METPGSRPGFFIWARDAPMKQKRPTAKAAGRLYRPALT